jgi:dipeptidyl aminopeptidase/acylaminoacyl peptidase
MRRRVFPWLLPALVLAVPAAGAGEPAGAEPAPLIPREVLFGNPERLSPSLSPDGKRLAWVAPDDRNVLQVFVRTVGQQDDRAVTADRKRGIRRFQWAETADLLIYAQDVEGDENWHLYGVDLTTGAVRDYTPFQGVRAEWVASAPGVPGQALVSMNLRDRSVFDVYRLNLATGGLELDTQNPGDVIAFHADGRLQVRAAQVALPDGGMELRVRDTVKSPWRSWLKVGPDEVIHFHAFTADGAAATLWTTVGSDTARFVERRLRDGRERVIAAMPDLDAGDVVYDRYRHRVQAVSFAAGRARWTIVDPSVQADFAAIERLHPGDFSIAGRDRRDRTWLLSFTQDRGPISYWAWDRAAKQGTPLFVHQSRLSGLALAEMRHVVIPSRDGLKLHSFLTLPVGVEPRKLPMVLLVHGGPWTRDAWGYHAIAQWAANRGYAVLQVNYRGSSGYGKKFISASFKEWGGKMQEDLLDAVAWAVQEGVADPSRVAIFGASYGGYATLAGLTFSPETFACGVDIVGPSNLRTFIETSPPYWKPMRGMLNLRIGNPDDPEGQRRLREVSPVFHAERIVRPLLIAHGAKDPRVKQEESEQIVSAIEKRGGKVTYVLYPDEGHGFARPPNRLDFYARAEAFLASCLGGRAEPMQGASHPGSSPVVRVIGGGG